MAVCSLRWSLLILVCLTKVAVQKIELTSRSLGSPDYYIDDTLNLNCTTSGYTIPTITAQRFSVDGEKDVGCTFSSDGWEPFLERNLSLANTNYCSDNADRTGFTLLANLQITPNSAGFQIRCQQDVNFNPIYSNTLTISTDLKVAPQGLAFMRINQEQAVVEGEAFEFQCQTTSASGSTYQYDLKRNGNVVRNLTETTYTPNEYDRDGFSIICVDTTHVNWRGGNTQTESEIISPLYIIIEGDEGIQRNVSLNPVRPLPLTCDVTGNPSPTFSWERKSRPLTKTSKSITIEADSVNDGDVEQVTCTAAVEGIPGSITITWMVTWDDEAQTSPTLITTTTPSSIDLVPIIVGVSLGALALVGIITGVCCWLKKRKESRGPSSNERGSSGALKHKIYTNETDKPRSAPPRNSRKLKKNNADDEPPFRDYKDEPIIYTEVDLNHKPVIRDSERVKSRRAPPPPMGEPVEYASIDLNRTAAYSKKNQNGGDEYENLGQHSDIPAVRAPSRPMRRQEH